MHTLAAEMEPKGSDFVVIGDIDRTILEKRPGILIVGSPNAGKRTLLSRLLPTDVSDSLDCSLDDFCIGWTMETKYYSADVTIWTRHLTEGYHMKPRLATEKLAAAVMVIDLTDISSFAVLKDWVSSNDIKNFDILLCVGNKADLLPGHSAYMQYRKKLQNQMESVDHPSWFFEYGIHEHEGRSLLENNDESPWKVRSSCVEWCNYNNVEYIEACASNINFDKCLSVDGDVQGVDRIHGALSAYMWPGLVLKSGTRIPAAIPTEDLSDEESLYEIDYELLSSGSLEPVEDMQNFAESGMTSEELVQDHQGCSETGDAKTYHGASCNVANLVDDGIDLCPKETSVSHLPPHRRPVTQFNCDQEQADVNTMFEKSISSHEHSRTENVEIQKLHVGLECQEHVEDCTETSTDRDVRVKMEEVEQLMCQMSHIRENLRLVPDFQRKETAAKMAMKLAEMFGESSDEGDF